jgi:hypothetical protein
VSTLFDDELSFANVADVMACDHLVRTVSNDTRPVLGTARFVDAVPASAPRK